MNNVIQGSDNPVEVVKAASRDLRVAAKKELMRELAANRPGSAGQLASLLGTDLEGFDHIEMRNFNMAKAGPAWQDFSDPSQRVKFFISNLVTELSRQNNEQVFVIHGLQINLTTGWINAEIDEVFEKLLGVLHFEGADQKYEFPFQEAANRTHVLPHAGGITGPTIIAGTEVMLNSANRRFVFPGNRRPVILPGDADAQLGFAWLHGSAGSAPTGTALPVNIKAYGRLFRRAKS